MAQAHQLVIGLTPRKTYDDKTIMQLPIRYIPPVKHAPTRSTSKYADYHRKYSDKKREKEYPWKVLSAIEDRAVLLMKFLELVYGHTMDYSTAVQYHNYFLQVMPTFPLPPPMPDQLPK